MTWDPHLEFEARDARDLGPADDVVGLDVDIELRDPHPEPARETPAGRHPSGAPAGDAGQVASAAVIALEQLERTDKVGGDGLRRWWVRFPDLRYDGKVLAPPGWTADQVLEALNAFTAKTSLQILQARLYSPFPVAP